MKNRPVRADDLRIANRGRLEALDAGVTTLVDYSHCIGTTDDADAATARSRGGALFAYGLAPE